MANFINNIQTVVLMGGLGTRLKDTVSILPKSMAEVYGKPFFHYQLELMKSSGIKKFVFCIGYRGEAIKNYFNDGSKFGVQIRYSDDGENPLGTAGALRKALPLLNKDFLVIYGDSYMDIDYSELIYHYYKFRENKKIFGLLAVYKNKNRLDKSNAIFKNGELLKYDKKNYSPRMDYIDYGISILDRDLVKSIAADKYTDLSDVFHRLVRQGRLVGYEVKNRFREIGSPYSLREFRKVIKYRLYTKHTVVFLDRDGTLNEMVWNEDTETLDSPLNRQELKLIPKTTEALKIMQKLGYNLIVITNQPAAAKGKTNLANIYEVNNKLRDILEKDNIYLADILMCPHHPVGSHSTKEKFLICSCDCRKPKTGLLKRAFRKLNVDIDKSFLVGDSPTDIIMAGGFNLKSVFLGDYKCDTCHRLGGINKPDLIFKRLYDFAIFLKNKRRDSR